MIFGGEVRVCVAKMEMAAGSESIGATHGHLLHRSASANSDLDAGSPSCRCGKYRWKRYRIVVLVDDGWKMRESRRFDPVSAVDGIDTSLATVQTDNRTHVSPITLRQSLLY